MLTRHTTVVLLIHGYNNNQHAADTAFHGFKKGQDRLGSLSSNPIGVYWPGDNWTSVFNYAASIRQARETAGYLARELRRAAQQNGLLIVDIVAHSMGCRLTLELLHALDNAPNIQIRRFAMLAGAVPVFLLRPPHRPVDRPLRDALDHHTVRCLSLFSERDKVLGYAFRAGQSVAPGREGFWPVALGARYWTGIDTLTPPKLEQQRIPGAGHSDYWGWRGDAKNDDAIRAIEQDAALNVRKFVFPASPPPRTVASRRVPGRSSGTRRETPQRRSPT